MAVHQQQSPSSLYVDLPELAETFADSIHTMIWDGQTLRVEFCVTRFPEPASSTPMEAKRYPACRMVSGGVPEVRCWFGRLVSARSPDTERSPVANP